MTILDLPSQIKAFAPDLQEKFTRIYSYYESTGHLRIPETMKEWVISRFGDNIDAIETQKLLRIENKITADGAVFNSIRAHRPQTKGNKVEITDIIAEASQGHFSDPLNMTPEDIFGRIKGTYCITATNVAKYDAWHGVIIFNEPNPLEWSPEQVVDYFDVAQQWFQKVHESDSTAVFPLFQWNCLWRAAASVVHGHAQITVAQNQAYSQIEHLRTTSLSYEQIFGSSYFDDNFKIHEALGLGWEIPVGKLLVPICCKKEREIQILAKSFDSELARTVQKILTLYRDQLHVQSFNLVGYLHPLEQTEGWKHMPILIRLIDRGDLTNKNVEIGVMERFAQEVIEHDPYETASVLQASL